MFIFHTVLQRKQSVESELLLLNLAVALTVNYS